MSNDVRKRDTIDQLHRVVLQAVIFANTVDRDDIAVMKPGRGFRFSSESLELFLRTGDQNADDFECNVPLERLLFGLIDDSHAATPDLPNQAKIPQSLRH